MKNIALHILDIVHNSIRAEAKCVEVYILQSEKKNVLDIVIKDNGKGMSREMLEKVTDPYTTSRTTRKVGMGISLLKQNAEMSGGTFSISSAENKGTMLNATFQLDHLDTPPIGDIIDTMVGITAGTPQCDFMFTYITDKGEYLFNTKEVKEVLEETPISDPQVVKYLKEMLIENIEQDCGIKLS